MSATASPAKSSSGFLSFLRGSLVSSKALAYVPHDTPDLDSPTSRDHDLTIRALSTPPQPALLSYDACRVPDIQSWRKRVEVDSLRQQACLARPGVPPRKSSFGWNESPSLETIVSIELRTPPQLAWAESLSPTDAKRLRDDTPAERACLPREDLRSDTKSSHVSFSTLTAEEVIQMPAIAIETELRGTFMQWETLYGADRAAEDDHLFTASLERRSLFPRIIADGSELCSEFEMDSIDGETASRRSKPSKAVAHDTARDIERKLGRAVRRSMSKVGLGLRRLAGGL